MTGLFEPHEFPDGRKKYFYIHDKHGEGFPIARLWDEWEYNGTGEKINTLVMLPIPTNELLRWSQGALYRLLERGDSGRYQHPPPKL